MIKINESYINQFKMFRYCYHYNVLPGIWLSFDMDTLEFIGNCYMVYPRSLSSVQKACDSKLNELISKGLLEVID